MHKGLRVVPLPFILIEKTATNVIHKTNKQTNKNQHPESKRMKIKINFYNLFICFILVADPGIRAVPLPFILIEKQQLM